MEETVEGLLDVEEQGDGSTDQDVKDLYDVVKRKPEANPKEPQDVKRARVMEKGASLAAALRAHPELPTLIATSEGRKLRILCHLLRHW